MIQAPYIREDEQSFKAVKTIKNTFIGKNVKITITDGRTFEGRFVCVDSEMNVILQGSYEYRSDKQSQSTTSNSDTKKRWAGMVMIPGKHITDVDLVQLPSSTTNPSALTAGEAMYG